MYPLQQKSYFTGGVKDKERVESERESHVMTEASAMNACAVASFLMHLTATLVPL